MLYLKLSALHKGKASIPLLRTPAAPKLCVPYNGVLMETRVEMENYVMPPHKIYMEPEKREVTVCFGHAEVMLHLVVVVFLLPVSSWYWLTHYSHHEAGHYPCMQRKIVRQWLKHTHIHKSYLSSLTVATGVYIKNICKNWPPESILDPCYCILWYRK